MQRIKNPLYLSQSIHKLAMAGVVVIAIDDSEAAEKAYNCKYLVSTSILFFYSFCPKVVHQ